MVRLAIDCTIPLWIPEILILRSNNLIFLIRTKVLLRTLDISANKILIKIHLTSKPKQVAKSFSFSDFHLPASSRNVSSSRLSTSPLWGVQYVTNEKFIQLAAGFGSIKPPTWCQPSLSHYHRTQRHPHQN